MSKKTAEKAVVTRPDTSSTAVTSPSSWSDWFDHWPEVFARRWPDSFSNMPFGMNPGEMLRIEHLTEEDGTIVVRAELPGIDPEQDVTISIDDGLMTISGERREQSRTEDKHGYRSEFRYGSFSRSVRLPVGACTDDVVATYRDGILQVRVPVESKAATVRHVPVTT